MSPRCRSGGERVLPRCSGALSPTPAGTPLQSLLSPRNSRWSKEMMRNVQLSCCVAGVVKARGAARAWAADWTATPRRPWVLGSTALILGLGAKLLRSR